MISSVLEQSIASLTANFLTDVFTVVLLLIFFVAIVWKRNDKHNAFTQYAPTLMATVGILGTFFGITVGLLGFDVTNIDGSIEALLAGMKTAFLTSLVGMLLSVVYKVLVSSGVVSIRTPDGIDEDQIGAADLYAVMRDQRDGILALQQAIGSGDESSLTGQMKLLRSDVNDGFKSSHKSFGEFQERLWLKLQDFADMMSKSATETVVDALRQVISDFNTNLTEQFGDNFKELNEAVHNLVEWQDYYKEQIAEMNVQYAAGVAAISDTRIAVDAIGEQASQIPESMSKLGEVMTVNQHQIDELGRHLDAFREIRDRAVEAVPEIREQIGITVTGMQEASRQLADGMISANQAYQEVISQGVSEFTDSALQVNASLQTTSDAIAVGSEKTSQLFSDLTDELHSNMRVLAADMSEQSRSIGEALRDSGKAVVEEAARSRDAFDSGLEAMRNQLANNLEVMANQQANQVQGLIAGLREAMDESVRASARSVEGSIQILDQAIETEINRSMEQMGRALVSITGKFTADYEQLVGQMERVLRKWEQ